MHPPAGPRVHQQDPSGNQALLSAWSHGPPTRPGVSAVRVTPRGAERWVRGHPWIYRSEVLNGPDAPGLVLVKDQRGRFIGQALYSPRSEIRLRLLERSDRPIDAGWWRERLTASAAQRGGIDATAYRLVHGEGDALPSLVVDRYDRWLVVQILVGRARDHARHGHLGPGRIVCPRGHPAPKRRPGAKPRGFATRAGAGTRVRTPHDRGA